METFKARLAAKCFSYKEEIDYEETFLPIAMLKSIRMLISITRFEKCMSRLRSLMRIWMNASTWCNQMDS